MHVLSLLRCCDPGGLRKYMGVTGLLGAALPRMGMDESGTYSLEPFIRTNSIFVHIPKTAGVSVSRSLYGNLAFGHRMLRDYEAIFRPAVFRRMLKFTFVRNPYDRIASGYFFLRRGGMNKRDAEFSGNVLSRYQSFERFILDGLRDPEVIAYDHFVQQSEFLMGRDRNNHGMDFVGRFESIQRDFDRIRKRVNPHARLYHDNQTSARMGRDYRALYSPCMVDSVAEIYRDSLDLLNYDFE